jgi:hypothetical protein
MSTTFNRGNESQSGLKQYERPILVLFGTVQDLTLDMPTEGTTRRQFLRNASVTAISLTALGTLACDGIS